MPPLVTSGPPPSQIATPISNPQENSDEIIQASKTLNSPSGYSNKNGITTGNITTAARIQSMSTSSSSLSITLTNQKKSNLNSPSAVNMADG